MHDVIVVGGGHNGLTAAAYLGRAGKRVLVLERRGLVGGAAITQEFHPGYRNSVASYTLSLLRGEIIRDLELGRHGLETVPYQGSVELLQDGEVVQFTQDDAHNQAEVARFSNRDFDAMRRLRRQLLRVGDVVRDQWLREPPDLGGGIESLVAAGRAALQLRKLDAGDRLFLVQMFTLSASDLMERWFESETMRQIYAVHCVSSNFSSLHQPGSAIPFFLNVLGELDGQRYRWGVVRGGMGAVSEALAGAARAHGVEIRTDAPVARILVEGGKAAGVRLDSGDEIRARAVASNADPKRTFLGLVGKEHLDPDFAHHLEHWRMGHASVRMNLALSGTPEFARLSGERAATALQSAITLLPDRATMERCYHMARAGAIPPEPYVNIQVASALDPGLAPPGHHVMALLCKYYPYHLAGGKNWDDIKEQVADGIITAVERHIPNLRRITVARTVMSPVDLERVFGLTEGDIFHGRHDLDQLFSLRPHPAAARYRTPVKGLYLCGSGAHPGGGVSGAPGHNAARRILKDLR